MDLLTLDPTGERARLLLAVRAVPVALGTFALSVVVFVVLAPAAVAQYAVLGDAISLLLALAMVGLAMGTAELTYTRAPRATTAVSIVGVVAGLAAAALSAGSMGAPRDALLPALTLAYAGVGVWLVLWNAMAFRTAALGRGFAVLGMLGGAAFILGAAGGEPPDPVAMLSGVLAVVGFPAWAWGARRAMLAAVAAPGRQAAGTGVNA